jgi:hypothetical protein
MPLGCEVQNNCNDWKRRSNWYAVHLVHYKVNDLIFLYFYTLFFIILRLLFPGLLETNEIKQVKLPRATFNDKGKAVPLHAKLA